MDAEFAAVRDLPLNGQMYDVVKQAEQCGRLYQSCPAIKRTLIGNGLKIDPTELVQNQAIGDELTGLWEAPVVEMLDDEHTQNDFYGNGGTTVRGGMREPCAEICFDGYKEHVIIEQDSNLSQHGVYTHPGWEYVQRYR